VALHTKKKARRRHSGIQNTPTNAATLLERPRFGKRNRTVVRWVDGGNSLKQYDGKRSIKEEGGYSKLSAKKNSDTIFKNLYH